MESQRTPIDQIGLPRHSLHALQLVGITSLKDLVERRASELMSLGNFGRRSLAIIATALADRGLTLAHADEPSEAEILTDAIDASDDAADRP